MYLFIVIQGRCWRLASNFLLPGRTFSGDFYQLEKRMYYWKLTSSRAFKVWFKYLFAGFERLLPLTLFKSDLSAVRSHEFPFLLYYLWTELAWLFIRVLHYIWGSFYSVKWLFLDPLVVFDKTTLLFLKNLSLVGLTYSYKMPVYPDIKALMQIYEIKRVHLVPFLI